MRGKPEGCAPVQIAYAGFAQRPLPPDQEVPHQLVASKPSTVLAGLFEHERVRRCEALQQCPASACLAYAVGKIAIEFAQLREVDQKCSFIFAQTCQKLFVEVFGKRWPTRGLLDEGAASLGHGLQRMAHHAQSRRPTFGILKIAANDVWTCEIAQQFNGLLQGEFKVFNPEIGYFARKPHSGQRDIARVARADDNMDVLRVGDQPLEQLFLRFSRLVQIVDKKAIDRLAFRPLGYGGIASAVKVRIAFKALQRGFVGRIQRYPSGLVPPCGRVPFP